jgi:hypothetical protein
MRLIKNQKENYLSTNQNKLTIMMIVVEKYCILLRQMENGVGSGVVGFLIK